MAKCHERIYQESFPHNNKEAIFSRSWIAKNQEKNDEKNNQNKKGVRIRFKRK